MLQKHYEIKKTRKEHRCYSCNKIIPIGSRCEYHVVAGCSEIYNGNLHDGYCCIKCINENILLN